MARRGAMKGGVNLLFPPMPSSEKATRDEMCESRELSSTVGSEYRTKHLIGQILFRQKYHLHVSVNLTEKYSQ